MTTLYKGDGISDRSIAPVAWPSMLRLRVASWFRRVSRTCPAKRRRRISWRTRRSSFCVSSSFFFSSACFKCCVLTRSAVAVCRAIRPSGSWTIAPGLRNPEYDSSFVIFPAFSTRAFISFSSSSFSSVNCLRCSFLALSVSCCAISSFLRCSMTSCSALLRLLRMRAPETSTASSSSSSSLSSLSLFPRAARARSSSESDSSSSSESVNSSSSESSSLVSAKRSLQFNSSLHSSSRSSTSSSVTKYRPSAIE
mmetsp:Transcript_33441/g.76424  ORF Transcript_33441/g.76424 Transcript_33441/m.76424 type:complete len:253 (-) Transcript_33441:124-882(-)